MPPITFVLPRKLMISVPRKKKYR